MADPVSIGILAVGTAARAIGSIAEGNAKADAENYNAAQAEANAKLVDEQAKQEELRVRTIGRQSLGGMRAAFGASGVTMEGSPLEVMAQSAANNEQDALNVRRSGELKAQMYKDDAAMSRRAAGNAITTGYLGAAGALASGASTYAMKRTG